MEEVCPLFDVLFDEKNELTYRVKLVFLLT